MRTETKTAIVLLGIITLIGVAGAWSSVGQPAIDAVWRVTPLNNGGYVIEGPMPELAMPAPAPAAMFSFESIDRHGNPQGFASIPVDRILSVGAEAWPVYDGDHVVAIRYGTAIRYGDGRWGWSERELHEVVAELISMGWASGDAPARWTHPLHDSLPVARAEWK